MDLDVGCNRLTQLPDSIGNLKQLRYLNAMSNQLTSLPDSIGGCTALLRCGLKNNQLTALPASMGQLSSLVELYLTGGYDALAVQQAVSGPKRWRPDGRWKSYCHVCKAVAYKILPAACRR